VPYNNFADDRRPYRTRLGDASISNDVSEIAGKLPSALRRQAARGVALVHARRDVEAARIVHILELHRTKSDRSAKTCSD